MAAHSQPKQGGAAAQEDRQAPACRFACPCYGWRAACLLAEPLHQVLLPAGAEGTRAERQAVRQSLKHAQQPRCLQRSTSDHLSQVHSSNNTRAYVHALVISSLQLLPVRLQRVGPPCSLPSRRQLPLRGRLAAHLALRVGEAEASRGADR